MEARSNPRVRRARVPRAFAVSGGVFALLLSTVFFASNPLRASNKGVQAVAPDEGVRTPVVLLHGLGRSERAMRWLEGRFSEAGFDTHAIGYDSRGQSIDQIVSEVDSALNACCAKGEQIHFVTHSLGGIVLRAWAEKSGSDRIARAVMLSPPNHGSAIVDKLGWFAAALGPTGEELGAHDDSTPNRLNSLGPVDFELGVIAGNRSLNPLGSWILDGPDDGTVSVASTRVEGMRDFLVLPSSHSRINSDEGVALQALHFVENGAFAREADPAGEAPR